MHETDSILSTTRATYGAWVGLDTTARLQYTSPAGRLIRVHIPYGVMQIQW